jgi:hypothetical protein
MEVDMPAEGSKKDGQILIIYVAIDIPSLFEWTHEKEEIDINNLKGFLEERVKSVFIDFSMDSSLQLLQAILTGDAFVILLLGKGKHLLHV